MKLKKEYLMNSGFERKKNKEVKVVVAEILTKAGSTR